MPCSHIRSAARAALALVLAAAAIAPAVAADFADFERSVLEQMKRQSIPGVAIAVRDGNGALVYAKGFGTTNAEDASAGMAVTAGTLFRLGSTAKVVTAAAILRKGLDLERPISAWAPELPAALGRLTLRQLLTHTAGLRDHAPMDGPHDESALAANVRSWDPKEVLMAEPGEVFSYANPGYVLAGYILERASDKPFATAALAGWTAFQRSTYRPFEAMTYPLALPHGSGRKVVRPFPDHAGAWPPGSLFSSAEEFSHFVSSEALKLAIHEAPMEEGVSHYGLGVMRSVPDGAVFHTGGRTGYGSSFYCLQGTCAVVLTNLTSVSMRSFAEDAVRMVAGLPKARPAATAPVVSGEGQSSSEDAAASVAGKYFNSPPIQVELRAGANGELEIRGPGNSAKWLPAKRSGGGKGYVAPGAGPLSRFRITMDRATGRPKFLHAEAWALRFVDEGGGSRAKQ